MKGCYGFIYILDVFYVISGDRKWCLSYNG